MSTLIYNFHLHDEFNFLNQNMAGFLLSLCLVSPKSQGNFVACNIFARTKFEAKEEMKP